jgi:hypothetical protein
VFFKGKQRLLAVVRLMRRVAFVFEVDRYRRRDLFVIVANKYL